MAAGGCPPPAVDPVSFCSAHEQSWAGLQCACLSWHQAVAARSPWLSLCMQHVVLREAHLQLHHKLGLQLGIFCTLLVLAPPPTMFGPDCRTLVEHSMAVQLGEQPSLHAADLRLQECNNSPSLASGA